MPEVVDRNRDFIACDLPAVRHVFFEVVEPFFRNVDSSERMCRVEEIVGFAAHGAGVDGAVGRGKDRLFVFPHFLKKTERCGKGSGDIHQKLDAEVHFQKSIALRHAVFESFAHIAPAAFGVGVAVDADSVTELPAEELPYGDAPRLARDVPQRNFDSADAARLPRVSAELFDAAENFLDVAGIFAQDAAFEHCRISAAGGVAHLAVAGDSLIGVNLEECAALRRAVDVGKAHVRDFECGRVDFRIHLFFLILS